MKKKKYFDVKRRDLVLEISNENNKPTKLRAMLLSDDIDSQDYKLIKK